MYSFFLHVGVYIPDCDDEGYYRPTQCHTSVGMCWCVDKHGVEMANSRTRGKPNCGMLFYNIIIVCTFVSSVLDVLCLHPIVNYCAPGIS